MKILYLDCGMGAAGDMLTAALVELLPDRDAFINEINALGLSGVTVKMESAAKCGITGTHIHVFVNGEEEGEHEHHHHEHGHHEHEHCDHEHHHHEHEHDHHEHHHSGMHEIEHIIEALPVPQQVKTDVLSVYSLIAEAESHAHGVPVGQIHFHEVGTLDAVADIVAVCMLMNKIAPDMVVASPIHVGSGQVRCAHGILPVPAPATAHILRNVPIYGGKVLGELCTPTGAALLKHFAAKFGDMPAMRVGAIGYGMGKKDFEAANCVRAFIGETDEKSEVVFELSCNVDDMTAEEIGFAMERLFEGGALDVYTMPIGMKKSRPGTMVRVLCDALRKENLISLLFKHTTTLGVRETKNYRYTLERRIELIQTPFGEVRRKNSSGYGVSRSKCEYDDLARIAREKGLSIMETERLIDEA